MQYLYHLTTKDAVNSILKNGLKPSIGERSKQVGETKKAIYICGKHDIPYWQAILGLNTVLKIDANDIEINRENTFETGMYTEYMIHTTIPPEKITVETLNKHKPSNKIIHDLALSYMSNISYLCVACAKYYTYKNTDKEEAFYYPPDVLQKSMETTLAVLNRLDYALCSTKEKRYELRQLGDGNYSFVDHYDFDHPWDDQTTRPKLYTMLIKYEKDELYHIRHALYKFITKNFKGCLDVDTGGWTG